MRRTPLTHRGGRQQVTVSVSLFPFLAVLVCTMGALILLLLVITRQARLQAAQSATAEAAKRDDDLKLQRELAQWRIEQLKVSLNKTQSQLSDARLGLGHLEDHARRLQAQVAQLQASLRDLAQPAGGSHLSAGGRPRAELEAELGQVQIQVAQARQRVAEARQSAAERRRSYAVVPYRGPHETFRRPIYVECRAEAVVLQPEGIVLTEDDFSGPLGPGNPLAAALRAARERLLAEGSFNPQQSGEPYPLLLVRPDGIAAYYAARSAMKSWDCEFGYELIGEDWKLDFQAADAGLAQVMQTAVDTARVRQQQLAAAAPSHYERQRAARYRASPVRGGTVPDVDSLGGAPSGYRRQQPAGGLANRFSPDGNGGQDRAPGSGNSGQERVTFQGPPREGPAAEGPAAEGPALRPGEWLPSETPAGKKEAPAGKKAVPGKRSARVESLAKHRGQDWGLPDAAGGSVPISRPIRVECHPDRLVIVPERGTDRSRSVSLRPQTEESIDEFVSSVWEHMQSWGMAGNGMYWRPILNVYVAPGAENRYAEFDALLEGSGLSVERKK